MGRNTIRLEGKLEHDEFYELADRYGILVMAGWGCCDHWEEGQHEDGEAQWQGAGASRAAVRESAWRKAVVSTATEKPAASGASGVKMRGPYDYVPPSYWLQDDKVGGAHGFATEITGGMAIPPVETLKKMLPAEQLRAVH